MLNNITKKILAITLGAATFMPASVATYKVFASKLEDAPESPVLSVVNSKKEVDAKSETFLETKSEKSTEPIEQKVTPQATVVSNTPSSSTVTPFPKANANNLSGKDMDSDRDESEDENEIETESIDKDSKKEESEKNEIEHDDDEDKVEWAKEVKTNN
jgi:hypothetical protein